MNTYSKILSVAAVLFLAFTVNALAQTKGGVQRLDLDSITLDGTTVTSTGAELNILDGVTSTAAELNILDGVTATAAEINLATDISAKYEDVTAANTLTTAECGKIMTLNSATEFDSVLPSPTAGCEFTFVIKAAPSGAAYTISTASTANILIGHVATADVNTAAADGDSSTADDTITFADGVAVVGDKVHMVSDGTSWYYTASAKVYNGITAAAVD